VTILGATGSIGSSTVDLLKRQPDRFRVEALTAHKNGVALAQLARELGARFAAVADPDAYKDLKAELSGSGIEAASGPNAVAEAARRPAEWVIGAITGAAGLEPALAAIERGATLALANKECLVCAGDLFMKEVRRSGATLLPVDSEHNAVFQVFDAPHAAAIESITLTASGGPFRTWTKEQMVKVSPAEACKHPNYTMGAKISVDSATLMNKGLELIEAHHLFGTPPERLGVVVHPQQIVHCLVAYVDGSVLAQLGSPDMRTPIAYALGYPDRIAAPTPRLDLVQLGQLNFESPDLERFPCLALAQRALRALGATPTILNAANEVAVEAFLAKRIGFTDIARVVESALQNCDGPNHAPDSIDDALALDNEARACTARLLPN
jgi:1-deoxy-D-xylulose-5-phosphate reductoisomerase